MAKKEKKTGKSTRFPSGSVSEGYHRELKGFIGSEKRLEPVPSGRPRHQIGDKKRKTWDPYG